MRLGLGTVLLRISNWAVVVGVMTFALATLPATTARSQIDYNEIADGFFSTDHLDPTPIGDVGIGTNTVRGSVSNARNAATATTDVYSFGVPAGLQVDSFILTDFSSGSNVGFVGFHFGNFFPHDAAGLDAVNDTFSGYQANGGSTFSGTTVDVEGVPTFFGTVLFDQSTNNLSDLSTQLGGPGFSAPLQAGTYTVYVQETSAGATDYEFSFGVSSASVPEPSSLALVSLSLVSSTRRSRRRS